MGALAGAASLCADASSGMPPQRTPRLVAQTALPAASQPIFLQAGVAAPGGGYQELRCQSQCSAMASRSPKYLPLPRNEGLGPAVGQRVWPSSATRPDSSSMRASICKESKN